MNVADDVSACDVGTSERFPIYLTGNDFSSLYGPAARPGRANFFGWEPTKDERLQILVNVLGERVAGLDEKKIRRLARRHRRLPIAGFVAAADELLSRAAYLKVINIDSNWQAADVDDLVNDKAPRSEDKTRLSVYEYERLVRIRESRNRRPGSYL